MKHLILLLLVIPAWGQKFNSATSGNRDDSALTWKGPQSVYASRPGSPVTGQIWTMTDTDCAGTASATPTQCRWSGSAWQATGGSGGGGGTTNPANALAYALTRTSSTVITALQYATSTTPHIVGITGNNSHIVAPSTVTITGGSGSDTLYMYVDASGTLTAGHSNLTMTCAGGCVSVSGITSYPEGANQIGRWTASSATWDTSGGTNDIPTQGVTRLTGNVTWTGTAYNVLGGGGISCNTYTIPSTSLTAAASSQEISLITGVAGTTGYAQSVVIEGTVFTGTTGLTVSIGRPGGTHSEMSGGPLPLMVSSGNFYPITPPIPQAATTYDVVANFAVSSGNVNAATAGSVTIKLCPYSM